MIPVETLDSTARSTIDGDLFELNSTQDILTVAKEGDK